MKAAMNRITEEAKRRDTIGRNRVSTLKDTQSFGIRLFDYQNNFSSDNVEKLTTILLHDETSHSVFILKYRIQIVTGADGILKDTDINALMRNLADISAKSAKCEPIKEEEGDDN